MIGTTDNSGIRALRNLAESRLIKTLMANPLMANPKDFALRYWRVIGLLALLVVALAGYAFWPRTTAPTVGSTAEWSRLCVAGVSYIQFTSGVSVEWTPAGRVKTCSAAAK